MFEIDPSQAHSIAALLDARLRLRSFTGGRIKESMALQRKTTTFTAVSVVLRETESIQLSYYAPIESSQPIDETAIRFVQR